MMRFIKYLNLFFFFIPSTVVSFLPQVSMIRTSLSKTHTRPGRLDRTIPQIDANSGIYLPAIPEIVSIILSDGNPDLVSPEFSIDNVILSSTQENIGIPIVLTIGETKEGVWKLDLYAQQAKNAPLLPSFPPLLPRINLLLHPFSLPKVSPSPPNNSPSNLRLFRPRFPPPRILLHPILRPDDLPPNLPRGPPLLHPPSPPTFRRCTKGAR